MKNSTKQRTRALKFTSGEDLTNFEIGEIVGANFTNQLNQGLTRPGHSLTWTSVDDLCNIQLTPQLVTWKIKSLHTRMSLRSYKVYPVILKGFTEAISSTVCELFRYSLDNGNKLLSAQSSEGKDPPYYIPVGLLPDRSCALNFFIAWDSWMTYWDQNISGHVIFLDFVKAFYTTARTPRGGDCKDDPILPWPQKYLM